MLAHPSWVYGVKTGHTDQAGSCLVSAGTYRGQQMIVTVLGAPDPEQRDRALLALYRYGASLYKTWRSPAAGSPATTAAVPYSTEPVVLDLQSALQHRRAAGRAGHQHAPRGTHGHAAAHRRRRSWAP